MPIVTLIFFVLNILLLGVVACGVWGTAWSQRKAYNEILKGLQSLDERMAQDRK